MKNTILLDRYMLLWKERNENVVVAEIRHYIENEHGGTLETPIGTLVCFKEERPVFWRVKIVFRNDFKYSQTRERVFIITKSAYKIKLKYYFEKLIDMLKPNFKAEEELDVAIKNYLLTHNWITEPFSISRLIEKTESFEFVGQIKEIDYT